MIIIMRKIYLIASLFLLCIVSCVEDNTATPPFGVINELIIENMEDKYEAEYGSVLSLKPEVRDSLGVNPEVEHLWYYYSDVEYWIDTLSTEKEIEITLNEQIPGTSYYVSFKVTNKETGVYSIKTSEIVAYSAYSDGMIVLGEEDSNNDLYFVSSKTGETKENIYSFNNDGEYLSDYSTNILVSNYYKYNTLGGCKGVMVGAQDATGGVYLDYDMMTKTDILSGMFFEPFDGEEIVDATYLTNGAMNSELLIVNGQAHLRSYGSTAIIKYQTSYMHSDGKTTDIAPINFAPAPSAYCGSPILYDNNNNKFIKLGTGVLYASILGSSDDDTTYFNPDDLGENMIMITGGAFLEADCENSWALMKNTATNEYFIIRFEMDGSNYNYYGSFYSYEYTKIADDVAAQLLNSSILIPGTKLNGNGYTTGWGGLVEGVPAVFFYYNDGKINMYNITSHSAVAIYDASANNMDVKCMTVDEVTVNGSTIDRLAVGFNDTSASGLKGKVAFFEITSVGGIAINKYYTSDGFCDSVKSFATKVD